MACTFEEALEKRLRTSKTEATREVLALSREMYVGDAISLVIESMSRQKTAQLRRWNDSWEGWCEWVEWEDRGWEIEAISSGIVRLRSPRPFVFEDLKDESKRPSDDAVAAALDASSARFLGPSRYSPRRDAEFIYSIR
jgi:hypothetical protein